MGVLTAALTAPQVCPGPPRSSSPPTQRWVRSDWDTLPLCAPPKLTQPAGWFSSRTGMRGRFGGGRRGAGQRACARLSGGGEHWVSVLGLPRTAGDAGTDVPVLPPLLLRPPAGGAVPCAHAAVLMRASCPRSNGASSRTWQPPTPWTTLPVRCCWTWWSFSEASWAAAGAPGR